MKIKSKDYEILKKMMAKTLEEHPNLKDEYKKRKLSAERYNFDIMHASDGALDFVCNVLYKYMNDSHLSTAFKRITGVKSL